MRPTLQLVDLTPLGVDVIVSHTDIILSHVEPEKVLQPNSEVIAVTTAPDEEELYNTLTRVAVS